ncbi:50S ribosomal protein L3 [Candidatus Aerophobetes bacterium]|uniref:Large ribosomal subunit protein uL3 n=1 Tax=Aerophobetes bacterium TaxID=2030807 RepID=A0A497E6K7_UNCAE|nr:MAG: 50S ribosomal protein L3 [Candidatus Aerophobetes bacterium]
MMKAILGKKLGMTQVFDGDELVPVTVIEAKSCVIVQKKTKEKDGYTAVQLGLEELPEDKVNKPLLGHFKKSEIAPRRYLKEIRTEDVDQLKVGEEIKVDIFNKGDLVNVTGISKGKGFQGVVKRHGFKGGPASHGAKQWHRRPGSIGASSDPSRVFKGKKMPGRMGARKVTVRNLEVVGVEKEQSLLLVKGSVPGKRGSLLVIKASES